MTKEELARALDGTEYPLRVPPNLLAAAQASGLVVISGYSDDNVRFEGAFFAEFGCLNGGVALIDRKGIVPHWRDLEKVDAGVVRGWFGRKDCCTEIRILWCKEEPYAWTFDTVLPHASFDVLEDGERQCRAIVVALEDMPKPAS